MMKMRHNRAVDYTPYGAENRIMVTKAGKTGVSWAEEDWGEYDYSSKYVICMQNTYRYSYILYT